MSELNFDDKNKKEVEANAAKKAEEEALAKKIAEEAKAPVNNANDDLEARIEEAWKQQAQRAGYPNRPRPDNWGGHIK